MSEAYVRHRHVPHRLEGRENFADAGRTDRFYRFSVKCDREENDKIAKMAKAAGMTPTDFVQRHFEQLFAEPKAEENPSREIAKNAVKGQVTSEDRVLNYMKALSDKNGRLTFNRSHAAEDMSCSYETLGNRLQALIISGKVTLVSKGSKFAAATFKINGGFHG